MLRIFVPMSIITVYAMTSVSTWVSGGRRYPSVGSSWHEGLPTYWHDAIKSMHYTKDTQLELARSLAAVPKNSVRWCRGQVCSS